VQCTATRRALSDRGIAFESVDVDELRNGAAEELRALGFLHLPVVQVPGMVPWSGFRPDLIDAIGSEAE
jgi:glutaredoxin-like protein NrdH